MLTYEQRNKLKTEVSKTIDIINKKYSNKFIYSDLDFYKYKEYDFLYHQATEDMATYYKEYNKPNTFLTVGASGDQILNAVAIGAKKIDVFDCNHLSKRGCALKISGAKTLPQEELQKFFMNFGEDEYKDISVNLDEEDLTYWNAVYDFVGEEGIRRLFPYQRLEEDLIIRINPYLYLDKDDYKKFQKQLEEVEINYIDCSLYSLGQYLEDNTYDGMTFSNIYEYVNYDKKTGPEKAHEFYDFIMKEMYPRLNKDGMMMISYMYAFNDSVKEYFDETYMLVPDKLAKSGPITLDEYQYHLMGFTSQNYSYSLLLDEFKNDPVLKLATEHVEYGQSKDMSHDMALCLKK